MMTFELGQIFGINILLFSFAFKQPSGRNTRMRRKISFELHYTSHDQYSLQITPVDVTGVKIMAGDSTDNVRPDRGLDRSNSRLAGHFDRSFLDANIL